MAELFKFQELGDLTSSKVSPRMAAISSDAMTVIVANSTNVVDVHQRHGPQDEFSLSKQSYVEHAEGTEISALGLQDAGVHAVSGDSDGWLHVWRTDAPEFNVQKKFKTGRVLSVAISRQYILVSFMAEQSQKGVMALIKKGYNLEDPWIVIKRYEGYFSRCAVSEHGKPLVPQLMYYTQGKIVYEENPNQNSSSSITYPQESMPWCMRRNTATAADLLVFGILLKKTLVLWAPQVESSDDNPNPMSFTLSSKDALKINQSLVMSSVVSSTIFLACIYDSKVNIIRARRTKDIEGEKKRVGNGKDDLLNTAGKESVSDPKKPPSKTVLEIMAEHIKDPKKPIVVGEDGSGNEEDGDPKFFEDDYNEPSSASEVSTTNIGPKESASERSERLKSPKRYNGFQDLDDDRKDSDQVVPQRGARSSNDHLPQISGISTDEEEVQMPIRTLKQATEISRSDETTQIQSSSPEYSPKLSENEVGQKESLLGHGGKREHQEQQISEEIQLDTSTQDTSVGRDLGSMSEDRFWSLF